MISGGLDYVSRRWNYVGRERVRGGLRHSNQLPAGLSPGVEGYLRCARSGRRTGAPQRDSQVREMRMQATLAYLTEKSSSLLPRHLNERKISDGESASKKGREREQSREVEEPFRSRFGVWPVVFILRVVSQLGLFSLLVLSFNIYILI